MRYLTLFIMLCTSPYGWGDSCYVQQNAADILERCLQNHNTPPSLFRSGLCGPAQPEKHRVRTQISHSLCPTGFWGACRNASLGITPYRYDQYYYGTLTRANAKHRCAQQRGIWMETTSKTP